MDGSSRTSGAAEDEGANIMARSSWHSGGLECESGSGIESGNAGVVRPQQGNGEVGGGSARGSKMDVSLRGEGKWSQ